MAFSRQAGAVRQLAQLPQRSLFNTQAVGRRLFDVSSLAARAGPQLLVSKAPPDKADQPPESKSQKAAAKEPGATSFDLDQVDRASGPQVALVTKTAPAAQMSRPLMIRALQKPIKDHPEFQIRNDGVVVDNNDQHRKLYCTKDGYIIVYLKRHNLPLSVHRLVAHAFVPNPDPDNKTHVDHINGVKHDNRADNLRWATPKENWNYWAKKEPERARRAIYAMKSKASA